MSAPSASYTVVLNQQREQAAQHHHEQCDKATIVPCKHTSHTCTVVENGQVVVKLIPVKSAPVEVESIVLTQPIENAEL